MTLRFLNFWESVDLFSSYLNLVLGYEKFLDLSCKQLFPFTISFPKWFQKCDSNYRKLPWKIREKKKESIATIALNWIQQSQTKSIWFQHQNESGVNFLPKKKSWRKTENFTLQQSLEMPENWLKPEVLKESLNDASAEFSSVAVFNFFRRGMKKSELQSISVWLYLILGRFSVKFSDLI